MKIITKWDEWVKGEINQRNQIHDPSMFGTPIDDPKIKLYLDPTGNIISREIGLAELDSAMMYPKELPLC